MRKHYTLSEYCIRFEVDFPTRKKMNKLSLLQSRISGGNGITRGSRRPLEFWKELHAKAENTSRIPSLFFSVPCYIRKTPAMEGVDPCAFYSFMKEHYRGYNSKLRHGDAFDDLVFLFADLQAGASQFLNKPAGPAPQKRQEITSAPEPNTCSISGNTTQGSIYVTMPEKGPGMALSAAEGQGLLGFVLGALSGAAVAVACVVCCF
jgi:hypothetical protein